MAYDSGVSFEKSFFGAISLFSFLRSIFDILKPSKFHIEALKLDKVPYRLYFLVLKYLFSV